MSNIIRLNETAPNSEWIVMSNQGTDSFLDLLITAADIFEKTEHQEELLSFLKDQKDINDIAPGTAGFDITEMPWGDETLVDDAEFLLRVSAEAQNESVLTKLPYDADRDIVIPWVDGADPAWQEEKRKYSGEETAFTDSRDSRYRDWGLMKYWFRMT